MIINISFCCVNCQQKLSPFLVTKWWQFTQQNGDRLCYFNDFSICHHFLVTRAKLDKSRLWRDLSMILSLDCHHCHQCHHFLVTPLKIIFKKLCNTAKIVTNYTQVLEQIHKGIFRVKNATYLPKPLLEHFVV